MVFEHVKPSARFTVPDRITVRQQLQYFSEASIGDAPVFLRLWQGAVPLIEEWTCEVMPDKDVDLNSITDPNVTLVLVWAGLEVKKRIEGMNDLPKN